MTSERFAALADAYGGDIDRWPESERRAAWAYLQSHPEARPVLLRQAGLDVALAAWAMPHPTASLAAGIARNVLDRQALLWRLRLWLSSAGAATALAGGVAAGMSLVAVPTPPPSQWTGGLYELQVLGVPLDAARPASLSGTL